MDKSTLLIIAIVLGYLAITIAKFGYLAYRIRSRKDQIKKPPPSPPID